MANLLNSTLSIIFNQLATTHKFTKCENRALSSLPDKNLRSQSENCLVTEVWTYGFYFTIKVDEMCLYVQTAYQMTPDKQM